ncbi:MAG: hypothetical protein ABI273_06290 [Lacunisphaera sp.]
MPSKFPQNKLLPRREFVHRLSRSIAVGAALLLLSLAIGIVGYHLIGGLACVDAFLDSSMILSGMGPVSPLHTDAAKLFAGCYAIYCGVMLLATTGVILAPLIHRSLHKFRLEWDVSDN